jgi:hypothetical protein
MKPPTLAKGGLPLRGRRRRQHNLIRASVLPRSREKNPASCRARPKCSAGQWGGAAAKGGRDMKTKHSRNGHSRLIPAMAGKGRCADRRACRLRGQVRIQGPSPHAQARLRLCARQQRARHASAAKLPWAPQHPAHGALLRNVAYPVQGLLAALTSCSRPYYPGCLATVSLERERESPTSQTDRGSVAGVRTAHLKALV